MRALFMSLMMCLAHAPGPAATQALELTDAQHTALSGADVVILGEVHDNAAHHAGQGAVMRMLRPAAVVFEMMSPQMAARAADAPKEDWDAFDAAVGWSEAGWPAAALYAPVFDALGDAAIVGAAPPREEVRRAFGEGAAAVIGAQAARFDLDQPLPEAEQQAREAMQFDAHCEAMPRALMGGMVEAQRYRDAAFANATLQALARHGRPVVVITGHGHARKDWGMPALLARAAPEVAVVSVGFLEAPAAGADPRFDLTFVTAAANRGDPCAAFR